MGCTKCPAFGRPTKAAAFALAALLCTLPVRSEAQSGPALSDVAAQADQAERANDLPKAASLYRQALTTKPDWADGWLALGRILYTQNLFPDAAGALTKATQYNPHSEMAWALLGLSEFELRNYDDARRALAHALERPFAGQEQLEGVVRYHQALLLARAGQFDAATDQYRWFIQKGEAQTALLLAVGLTALHDSRFPEELKPEERPLFFIAGKAAYLAAAGAREQAGQIFQELLTNYGTAPYVHYFYGAFLLKGNDFSGGLDEMRKELATYSENPDANVMAAWVLIELDRYSEAFPYAQKAAVLQPERPLVELVYGRCLLQEGDAAAAIPLLERAETAEPDNRLSHIALAVAYSKSGRSVEARRERMRAMELSLPAESDRSVHPAS